jgi:hypothetical protein
MSGSWPLARLSIVAKESSLIKRGKLSTGNSPTTKRGGNYNGTIKVFRNLLERLLSENGKLPKLPAGLLRSKLPMLNLLSGS